MADVNELRDLRERICRLRLNDQLHLFEIVLAEYRRQREETLAWMIASEAEFLELEKRQREMKESASFPPEAKREAG